MWILKGSDEAWVVEVGRVKLRTSKGVAVDYWVHTLLVCDHDDGDIDNDCEDDKGVKPNLWLILQTSNDKLQIKGKKCLT